MAGLIKGFEKFLLTYIRNGDNNVNQTATAYAQTLKGIAPDTFRIAGK